MGDVSVTRAVDTGGDATIAARAGLGERTRLFYLDNLRTFVIVCVLMHHLAVTYSGVGSWYYEDTRGLDTLSKVWFTFYLSFQQAYFMGLMFLIAGYFVGGSYDRRGSGAFAVERLRRLGIPTLIFMVVVDPFINLVELRNPFTGFNLVDFLSATGPMWFAAALLIFSLVYAGTRVLFPYVRIESFATTLRPSFKNLALLALGITVLAFLIRIVQPIGTSILNMQLCFFASYVVLFCAGIVAYRGGILDRLNYRAGKWALIGALAIGFPVWLSVLVYVSATGQVSTVYGGLTWESAAYAIWESSTAVAVGFGLIVVFRERFNHQGRLAKAMSDSSFTVYMFHPPFLVAIALLFTPLALAPIAKWAITCIICVPLCFAAAYFVFRRIPLLKSVL
jgi:glucan biosynthesis protein C